jgi:hypothetical protein
LPSRRISGRTARESRRRQKHQLSARNPQITPERTTDVVEREGLDPSTPALWACCSAPDRLYIQYPANGRPVAVGTTKHNGARPIPADLPHSPRPIWKLREVADTWPSDYNEQRPHDSLARAPPLTFLPIATSRPGVQFNTVRLTGKLTLSRWARRDSDKPRIRREPLRT